MRPAAKITNNQKDLKLNLGPDESATQVSAHPITCVSRTLQCITDHGFRNFRILTMTIVDGIVQKVHYSDAYCNIEAQQIMESAEVTAAINLNMNWKEGECLRK